MIQAEGRDHDDRDAFAGAAAGGVGFIVESAIAIVLTGAKKRKLLEKAITDDATADRRPLVRQVSSSGGLMT